MGLDATMISFTHGLSDGLPDIVQVQCTMSSIGIHTYGRVVTTALRVTACGTSGALGPSELPGPTAWIAVSGVTRPPCVVEVSEA